MIRMTAAVMAGLAFGFAAGTVQADTITIRADVWCPFNCEPGSDRPGFAVEVARAAFAPFGHTVEYETMPWTRAVSDCRTGAVIAVVGAAKDDAPDFVFPNQSAGVSGNSFVVRKGYQLADRLDVTLDARAVLLFSLAELKLRDQVDFAGTVDIAPFYVAFSPALPKSKEYAELYDRGVARLRASGELKAILDRYGVDDWQ